MRPSQGSELNLIQNHREPRISRHVHSDPAIVARTKSISRKRGASGSPDLAFTRSRNGYRITIRGSLRGTYFVAHTHIRWIISIYRTCNPKRRFRKYRKRITSHMGECIRGFINSGSTSFRNCTGWVFQPLPNRLPRPIHAILLYMYIERARLELQTPDSKYTLPPHSRYVHCIFVHRYSVIPRYRDLSIGWRYNDVPPSVKGSVV